MISISKLLYDTDNFGDSLRYAATSKDQRHGAVSGRGPVVVWNGTRTCNLKCRHCYSSSDQRKYEQMNTDEAKRFIGDLVDFKVPVLLFSGGEPLMRPDFLELASYARQKGLHTTLSTNGTLITPEMAASLKKIGLGYVGISLDGMEEVNDRFRGKSGAFRSALQGIRNCLAVGQKVGLRFTISRHNHLHLDDFFDLVERENVPRICFYHLVYSGRAMLKEDVSHSESRAAMDVIIRRTLDFHERGLTKEVLTVDNHADAVYVYLKLLESDPEQAERARALLLRNGGNRSGIAIGQVDWAGNVHPDQFTSQHCLGNVKERKFGDIWTDTSNEIMAGMKDRKPLLKGRCAKCQWLPMCNGNFRTRAEAAYGDFWAEDPACYLTDAEIGLEVEHNLAGAALK